MNCSEWIKSKYFTSKTALCLVLLNNSTEHEHIIIFVTYHSVPKINANSRFSNKDTKATGINRVLHEDSMLYLISKLCSPQKNLRNH